MKYLHFFSKVNYRIFPSTKIISDKPMLFPCGVSRSGTTLLSAILDAHSQVCMGYEMMFKSISGVGYIIEHMERIRLESDNLKKAGSLLRKQGHTEVGKWISRCHRLDFNFDELVAVLHDYQNEYGDSLVKMRSRLLLVKRVVDNAMVKSNASIAGFKINDIRFDDYLNYFPLSSFIYILRDPRDVYCSLKERGFDLSIQSACNGWIKSIHNFEKFQDINSDKCFLIRYEDLVRYPKKTIEILFDKLNLPVEENVLNFHNSKSRILKSSHPNAEKLKKGFFSSSVGRYKFDLSREDAAKICNICKNIMEKYNYQPKNKKMNNDKNFYSISKIELMKKQAWLLTKRKYQKSMYAELLKPYIEQEYEIMTILDYVRQNEIGDRKILMIRHDVDHDHLTAKKIAKWEYDHGIKATYCLLHSAWYYGKLEDEKIRHTKDLVECSQFIADLGHEINFHNNLVVTALQSEIDPVNLLKQELAFFDSIGIQIKGTSTHGDALCREYNFRNWELFKECCDDRFGGPRILEYEGDNGLASINLGKHSMFDFGLEYEAYDMSKDIYHTDSGGVLRTRQNTKGRKNFGRVGNSGHVVGVLTHPIWWKFF